MSRPRRRGDRQYGLESRHAQNLPLAPRWRLSTHEELAALKPLRVVPAHGDIGDAGLIDRWGNPNGSAATARAALAEAR